MIIAVAAISMGFGGCGESGGAESEHLEYVTTVQEFEKLVLKADKPVLVDFHATWCGPCKRLAPIISKLAEQYDGRAVFVKVNTDKARELAMKYGIKSIPAVLIFNDGKVVKKIIGLRGAGDYSTAIDAALAAKN